MFHWNEMLTWWLPGCNNPQKRLLWFFSLSNISFGHIRRCFFHAPKIYVIIVNYQNRTWIGLSLWIQCVPNLFRICEYFENSKFKYLRFHCSIPVFSSVTTVLDVLRTSISNIAKSAPLEYCNTNINTYFNWRQVTFTWIKANFLKNSFKNKQFQV